MAAPITGGGTCVSFATSAFTARIVFVGGTEETRERLDTSHIGLAKGSQMQSIPAALYDPGEFEIRWQYDPTKSARPPIDQDPEVVTVTYNQDGQSTPSSISGTAFLTRAQDGDAEMDVIMEGEGTIVWDGGANGGTAKTYSAGTP